MCISRCVNMYVCSYSYLYCIFPEYYTFFITPEIVTYISNYFCPIFGISSASRKLPTVLQALLPFLSALPILLNLKYSSSRFPGYLLGLCSFLILILIQFTTATPLLMPISWQAGGGNFGFNLSTPSFAIFCILVRQFKLYRKLFYYFVPPFSWTTSLSLPFNLQFHYFTYL